MKLDKANTVYSLENVMLYSSAKNISLQKVFAPAEFKT